MRERSYRPYQEAGLRCLIAGWLAFAFLLWSPMAEAQTSSGPTAVLLLKTSSAQGSTASFGRSAVPSAAARALREPFEAQGMRFVRAAGVAVNLGDPPGGLPLSDAAAIDMARQAGASVCVVVGIGLRAVGKIRATQLVAHEARLRIRVLDAGAGAVVADTSTKRFGYAPDADQAAGSAQAASIAALGKSLDGKLRARWPAQAAASGSALTLQIGGAQGWRPVASILKQLAASKGIKFVHALAIQGSQVRLSVSTAMSAASLVALLQRTRIHQGTISVISAGNTITMEVRALPSGVPLSNG